MKKVLSFVLVLAMILGSVSMAFAFTDDTAITNKEAAAVLNAAGVIEGYTDGSFKASGILTRAEGAAIAARLVLGKSEAAKLTTVVAPFNDVPASHWAAGYISYCVSQGYLNGYGNGNFGPDDTLTVAQFGKMMLTLLGYKSENEGFVGDAWETNVGSVMVKAGLTDGVTLSGSNACSREVAAQVALNTLKGELVVYEGTPTTVSTGTVTVTTGQSNAKNDKFASGDKGYNGVVGNYKNESSNNANVRFMNRYQKKLEYKAVSVASDAFGRPGTYRWNYDGKKVYTTDSETKLLAKYTTKVSEKTLYALLDENDATDADLVVYTLDGLTVTSGSINAAGIHKNYTASFGPDEEAIQWEVYYDSSEKDLYLVAYRYYLVQATADYNASNKTVKIAMESSNGPVLASNELKSADFDVENVKDEDYLIITAPGGEVKSVVPATMVTGTVTAYETGKNMTVDGTKYTQSASVVATDNINGIATNNTVAFLLDPNNFVVKLTDKNASAKYVFIKEIAKQGGVGDTYEASAYFVDGTSSTIIVKKTNNAAGVEVPLANGTPYAWFKYTVNSENKYTLTAVTNTYSTTEDYAIAAAATNPTTAGAIVYYPGHKADTSTVFIVKKGTDVKLYTGRKNVPGSGVTNATVSSIAKAGFDKYAFIEVPSNTSLTGVGTSDYALVYKRGTASNQNQGDDSFYTYGKVFSNGEVKTIEWTSLLPTNTTANNMVRGAFYFDLAYDTNGRIDGGSTVTGGAFRDSWTDAASDIKFMTDATDVTSQTAIYKNGVLSVPGKNYEVADDAVIYVVDCYGAAPGAENSIESVNQIAPTRIEKSLERSAYKLFLVFDEKVVKAAYFIATNN